MFAFGGSQGIIESLMSVVFLDGAAGHSLAAGYTPGTVVDFGSAGEETCLSIWGEPTVNATAIAAVDGEPDQMMIYGIKKVTSNAAGEPVQHRVATVGIRVPQ